MYTLLDTCLEKLDIPVFISHLVSALNDHYDIKMSAHLMLIRLATLAPAALVEALDSLIEPLRTTIAAKVKDTDVKQQVDRNDEMVRSALRAVAIISRVPNVDSNVKFSEFVKQTRTGEFAQQFEAFLHESEQQQQAAEAMDTSS